MGPCLLQGVLVCICTTVRRNKVVRGNGLRAALLLKPLLDVPDVALDQTDVALALRVGSIGVLKGNSKVNDVRVELLLHAKSLHLALGLCLKGHLHAFNGLAKVLPSGGKLLLLLGNSSLDLLLHLGQLKRGPENLVLLLLESSLSLRECSLKLKLLSLQTLPDFVNLMDGAAALADLVHDVLDLVGEHLVLSTDFLQLQHRLVVCILDAEQLRRNVASLLLGNVQIHTEAVHLVLPFANNAVKLLGLLLHSSVENLSLVQLLCHIGSIRSCLCLGHLQLLSLCNPVNLILLPPHVSIAEGLVQLPGEVLLGTDLLVIVLLQAIGHVLHVAVFAKEAHPLLGLVVSNRLHLIQGGDKGGLGFGHQACIGRQLLQLAEQVSIFGRDSPLALLKISEI